MENINRETDITLEQSTPVEVAIQDHLNGYYNNQSKIDERLLELDHEMDVDSYMQTENTALTLAGVVLSITSNRAWIILPLATSLLSFVNIVRGRNNPLPVFRKLGLRTRAEIEKERYALKAIRGDFKYLLDVPNAVWNAVNK